MNRKWVKYLSPPLALFVGFAGMTLIAATKAEDEEQKPVDVRPTVVVQEFPMEDYQAVITSFGELAPLERTRLAAQVSGEVIAWHEHFVPGGLIKRGEILFEIEKDSYEAALMQAQAALAQAEAVLIEERARAAVAEQEAKSIAKSKVTDLYLRKPQVLSAEAAVTSARAALKLARRDLENCVVRAPYDALIVSRDIGNGQFVMQGTPIAELYNVEYAEINFPIAGFDTAFLPDNVSGLTARVTIQQLKKVERQAEIVRDLGVVDNATRMGQLVARISDPYGLNSDVVPVKFGSYAEINFVGQTLESVYRLPQELVNNQTVWVLGPDQRLEPRTVAVIREEGEFFLIKEGIHNDDKVVTTLPNYPRKGMEVKLIEPNAAVDSQSEDAIAESTDAEFNQDEAKL